MVFWTKFLYPDISEEGKEEISFGHVGVFCQNLGISAYILENCSNSKNKFWFNNGSILTINDYYRSRGNVSYTELCQIINILSN